MVGRWFNVRGGKQTPVFQVVPATPKSCSARAGRSIYVDKRDYQLDFVANAD